MSTADALPTWDLSDLYNGMDDPHLDEDFARAEQAATDFAATYQGKLADLSGDELAKAVKTYEDYSEIAGKIGSFAGLLHAGDTSDGEIGRFYQGVRERLSVISSKTLFFTLELNKLDDATLTRMLDSSAALRRYQPWLRDLRSYRPYQLDDGVEKVLHEQHVVGTGAWVRLFDQTMADLRFDVDGKELTFSEVANMLSSAKADDRKKAADALGTTLQANIKLLTYITNTLAKDKSLDDGWRGYEKPWSYRNLSNQVEDEVVDALASAVKASYAKTSHRYYQLKAKWMGTEKLPFWDRNAPLPGDEDRSYSWDQAQKMVLSAYGDFSPHMADLGRKFFESPWIDVPPRPGKDSGAFAHPTVPSAHPYLLLNFHGKSRDVMTLAHELGHGVHQLLAAEQGYFLSDTPLTLAETASVFGEMLTFQAMLRAETDPKRRRILLAGKVEDMINTVVRQIAFFEFERKVHIQRQEGELSPEDLAAIWLDVQGESLGPAFDLPEEYGAYWSYIPHFIHSPFYVYAYAFGDCLVNSLYDLYAEAESGFQDKYFDMLRAGGTLGHKELLAPFGLDASDPAFWQRGLNVLIRFIDELEAMEEA